MSSILNFFLVAEFSCAILDSYSWTAPRVSCMLCEIRFNLIFFFLSGFMLLFGCCGIERETSVWIIGFRLI